jgi:2-polyprenyl-3-methyl-5-hydroxy-6-metoxy-1,4-benzoquinol methylase
VTSGVVVRCHTCGHGAVGEAPADVEVAAAYAGAEDEVSLREVAGQEATADRALARIERLVRPAAMCDLGCWTGSFVAAARTRGWEAVGIEPSEWASAIARSRGLDVRTRRMEDHGLAAGSFRLVVMADVLEHLAEPRAGLASARDLLEPGGLAYLTVPDAGSALARVLGRRWWSVLPMHLQYFTRASMKRLLRDGGFEVLTVRSHAKAFTARYYAERLHGYSPSAARAGVRLLQAVHAADRLVAPDFHDRMAVVARRIG